jgi:hypothetical protein
VGEQNNCWAWDGHRGRDHRRKRAEQNIKALAYHIKNNVSATCWSQIGKNDFWNPHDELRFLIEKAYRTSGFGGKRKRKHKLQVTREENHNSTKYRPNF